MNNTYDFQKLMFESEIELRVKKVMLEANFSRQDFIRIAQPLTTIIVDLNLEIVPYTEEDKIKTYVSKILSKLSQVKFTRDSFVCIQNPRKGDFSVAASTELDLELNEKIGKFAGGNPHSNKANTVYAYGRKRKIYVKVKGEFRQV